MHPYHSLIHCILLKTQPYLSETLIANLKLLLNTFELLNTKQQCLLTNPLVTRPRVPPTLDHRQSTVCCSACVMPVYGSNRRQVLRQATTLSPATLLAAMAAAPRRLSSTMEEARPRTAQPQAQLRTRGTGSKRRQLLPVPVQVAMAGRDGYN